MVPLFLFSLVFLLIGDTTSRLTHHVINLNSSTLQFSSLQRDTTMQDFVVGSAMGPIVYVSNLANTSISNNHTLGKRIICKLKNFNDGHSGIMYLSHGYILVVQTTTGKIFKVDTIDGTMSEVLSRDSSIPLALSGHGILLQSKKSIIVTTNQSLLLIESDDNNWAGAATIQNKMNMKEKEIVVAIAMQEGENYVYIVVNSKKGYRTEEVIWGGSTQDIFSLICFISAWFSPLLCILWVEYFNYKKPFYGNWDWKGYDHENVPLCYVLVYFLLFLVHLWNVWNNSIKPFCEIGNE